MKCFSSKAVMEKAMSFDLCPYGTVNFYKSKYWFAPETKEEELKVRMGSHRSNGKNILIYNHEKVRWEIQFACSRVIKDIGISPCGGLYMD